MPFLPPWIVLSSFVLLEDSYLSFETQLKHHPTRWHRLSHFCTPLDLELLSSSCPTWMVESWAIRLDGAIMDDDPRKKQWRRGSWLPREV